MFAHCRVGIIIQNVVGQNKVALAPQLQAVLAHLVQPAVFPECRVDRTVHIRVRVVRVIAAIVHGQRRAIRRVGHVDVRDGRVGQICLQIRLLVACLLLLLVLVLD